MQRQTRLSITKNARLEQSRTVIDGQDDGFFLKNAIDDMIALEPNLTDIISLDFRNDLARERKAFQSLGSGKEPLSESLSGTGR